MDSLHTWIASSHCRLSAPPEACNNPLCPSSIAKTKPPDFCVRFPASSSSSTRAYSCCRAARPVGSRLLCQCRCKPLGKEKKWIRACLCDSTHGVRMEDDNERNKWPCKRFFTAASLLCPRPRLRLNHHHWRLLQRMKRISFALISVSLVFSQENHSWLPLSTGNSNNN